MLTNPVHAASDEKLSHTNLLEFQSADSGVAAVRSTNDWARRRETILKAMTHVMGPVPEAKRAALEIRIEEVVDCGEYIRQFLTYQSEPGSRVPAYLLIPKSVLGSLNPTTPAILTLHQTHSLGQKVVVGLGNSSNDVYGVELARRGYVCLAPAYPQLANYHPDLKALGYESGTMKAIWDNMRGLDLLETLPFVKRGSFGAIGHSLGGHNSIYTAIFDERIKVIVSSCGFDSYRDYKNGDISGWTSERYMPKLKQYAPDAYPFDFHELLGALAPRVVFVSAPLHDTNFKWQSVDAVAASARPVFRLHGVPEHLRIEHANCGHEFPRAMREQAYQLFDRHLR